MTSEVRGIQKRRDSNEPLAVLHTEIAHGQVAEKCWLMTCPVKLEAILRSSVLLVEERLTPVIVSKNVVLGYYRTRAWRNFSITGKIADKLNNVLILVEEGN